MDPSLLDLKWLASLGVGGALAALTLAFYRRDLVRDRRGAERREDRLAEVVAENAAAHERLAASITALAETIRHQEAEHGRALALVLDAARRDR